MKITKFIDYKHDISIFQTVWHMYMYKIMILLDFS